MMQSLRRAAFLCALVTITPWAAAQAADAQMADEQSARRTSTEPDEPLWQPGNETTASVEGEVTGEPPPSSDGVYGRFAGDLDIGAGLGAELDTDTGRWRGALTLTTHYFYSAGVYATYRDSFGQADHDPRRIVSTGIDVRPAFIPRWALNMQQGPPLLDLWIDSISLRAGAFWAQPYAEDFGERRGFETSLGMGLPLFAQAAGPWLDVRGQLRWPEGSDVVPSLMFGLSWHWLVSTPLARTVE
jgi:hypothetical protein